MRGEEGVGAGPGRRRESILQPFPARNARCRRLKDWSLRGSGRVPSSDRRSEISTRRPGSSEGTGVGGGHLPWLGRHLRGWGAGGELSLRSSPSSTAESCRALEQGWGGAARGWAAGQGV